MFMSLISHLLSGWFAFLLPSYSTYKALKHRPLSEPELERWATYWAVVGAFVAFEYGAEWILSWLPFYWEIKTLFLLFLSLPQTQGSTYIYKAYIEPFFAQHEADIDAGIASAQTETLAFLQSRFVALWDIAWSLLSRTPVVSKSGPQQNGQPASGQNPLLAAQGLWNTFGPSFMGSFQQPKGQPATSATSSAAASPSVEHVSGYNVEPRAPQTPEVGHVQE